MKKITFILLIIITSCTKNPETLKEHITGYWEIKEVILNDGTKKQYRINETIDYIQINQDSVGFRKKLKPNFNGTYETSRDIDKFIFKIENDSLHLYYKTPFSSWKETVLEATENKLTVVNQNKDLYLYTRFTPINLD